MEKNKYKFSILSEIGLRNIIRDKWIIKDRQEVKNKKVENKIIKNK